MAKPNKETNSEFDRVLGNIKASMLAFEKNANNFNRMKEFCFISTLTSQDKSSLQNLKYPTLEFNIVEPHINRLLGDFSIVNPQYKIQTANPDAVNNKTVDTVTSIIRKILYESQSQSIDAEVQKDILGGGYSVMSLYTEYAGEKTFAQDIKVGRVNDPTSCGFDPIAVMPHKGDGRWCFESYPISEEDFKKQFPDQATDGVQMARGNFAHLKWKWVDSQGNKFYNIVDYFEKETKRVKLHLMGENKALGIAEGTVFTDDELKAFIEQKILPGSPFVEPIPKQSEWRDFCSIVRYRLWGAGFLESKVKTNFDILPRIFFDCNSVTIDGVQTTRAFVQQAVGAQRAKNLTGNTMLAEIQGLRRTRMTVAQEALPSDPALQQAYTNPQAYYGALVYNSKDNQGNPLPPPQITPAAPIPPEIASTFNNMDGTMQGVLGSYQAQQGNLPVNISSETLLAGIGQSNSASKPVVDNYTASMAQLIKGIVSLIPKTYTTPRTMPVISPSGQRTFITINNDKESALNYEPNCLDLYVTPGVSFEQQKKESLQTMVQLSGTMPALGSLLNGDGLPILLGNLDVKDGDKLQVMAEERLKEQKEKPPEPPPEFILEAQKLEMKKEELAMVHQEKMAQIAIEQKKTESQETIEAMKFQLEMLRLIADREEMQARLQMSQNEDERALIDQQIKVRDQAIGQMRLVLESHLRAMDIHSKRSLNQPKIDLGGMNV